MAEQKITNEMLYELLQKFESDAREQFRTLREDLRDVKIEIREERKARLDLEKKVQEIYDVRDTFTVKFSRAFAGVNAFVSAVVACFVALLFNR